MVGPTIKYFDSLLKKKFFIDNIFIVLSVFSAVQELFGMHIHCIRIEDSFSLIRITLFECHRENQVFEHQIFVFTIFNEFVF